MSPKDDLEQVLGRSVSRETRERLSDFEHALLKWSPKINLVAKTTYPEAWSRHILDSAQLLPLAPDSVGAWCDLGSGGGLPGLVIAILVAETTPLARVVLIESDARKAAFLTLISSQLGLETRVLCKRIEETPSAGADVVSARALAPLPRLLGYCHTHLAETGVALLPKGRTLAQEVEAARQSWHFDLQTRPSRLDPESAILVIRNLRPMDGIR